MSSFRHFHLNCTLLACLLMAITPGISTAKPEFVSLIPNSNTFSCFTCHTTSIPARNPFGSDFAGNGKVWSAALATRDSDRDGRTNGQELLDPNGSWTVGQPNPGNPADVTNPGVADLFPTATPTNTTVPPTASQTPTQAPPSPTPTFTATVTETNTQGATSTPTETPLVSFTPTATVREATETASPTPTWTETPTDSPEPTPTETLQEIPSPTATDTGVVGPTPTFDGSCSEIEVTGGIASIDPLAQTLTVLGYLVQVSPETEIRREAEDDGKSDEGDDDDDDGDDDGDDDDGGHDGDDDDDDDGDNGNGGNDDGAGLTFEDLLVGDVVEVEGLRCGDTIQAREIKVKGHRDREHECDRELHGAISEIFGASRSLVVGMVLFRTDDRTQIVDREGNPIGFERLAIGDWVEIEYCESETGVPLASKIKREERDHRERRVRIEGRIQQIDPLGPTLTVRDTLIRAGGATLLGDHDQPLAFGDLEVGDLVKVEGYYDQLGEIQAARIRRRSEQSEDCETEIRGYINAIFDSTRTLVVGVTEIQVNDQTRIEDDRVEAEIQFADLAVGLAVKVVFCASTGQPVATKIEVKRPGDVDLDDDGEVHGSDLVRFIEHSEDEGVSLDLDGDDRTTSQDLFLLSTGWREPMN
ncbi:MAG: hypothetical protein HUU16_16340 [Candidatus Omnitrophica bacterium]|nr:hypothetical protein [Candidatus Omnitrophota bacterium]